VFANDFNLLDKNINVITKNTEALSTASKEGALDTNTEKRKSCLVLSCLVFRMKNVVAIKPFKNMAKFKYFGVTLANQIYIHEEIKNRLNSGNACCHLVQNLLSSNLLHKKFD
jgi:hypothetical protein